MSFEDTWQQYKKKVNFDNIKSYEFTHNSLRRLCFDFYTSGLHFNMPTKYIYQFIYKDTTYTINSDHPISFDCGSEIDIGDLEDMLIENTSLKVILQEGNTAIVHTFIYLIKAEDYQ